MTQEASYPLGHPRLCSMRGCKHSLCKAAVGPSWLGLQLAISSSTPVDPGTAGCAGHGRQACSPRGQHQLMQHAARPPFDILHGLCTRSQRIALQGRRLKFQSRQRATDFPQAPVDPGIVGCAGHGRKVVLTLLGVDACACQLAVIGLNVVARHGPLHCCQGICSHLQDGAVSTGGVFGSVSKASITLNTQRSGQLVLLAEERESVATCRVES